MRKHLIVISVFLVAPIVLSGFLWSWHRDFGYAIRSKTPLRLVSLKHRGGGEVAVYLVKGDVFEPKKIDRTLSFDLVPITCTWDPLWQMGNQVVWESNLMLRGALEATWTDPVTREEAIQQLVVRMSQNRELIRYFTATPPEEYAPKLEELRRLAHIYFWRPPSNGGFYRTSEISLLASVPIFSPSDVTQKLTPRALRMRLRDNLQVSLTRLFAETDVAGDRPIRTVAFALMGASETLLDSQNYLSYRDSAGVIIESVQLSRLPDSIDELYLVMWDKLPTRETAAVERAMFRLYSGEQARRMLNTSVPYAGELLVAFPYWAAFVLAYVLFHRNIRTALQPASRRNFIADMLQIVGFYALLTGALIWVAVWLLAHAPILSLLLLTLIAAGSYALVAYLSGRGMLSVFRKQERGDKPAIPP